MFRNTRPADKMTGIAPTANVTATFTEEMDDSTITGQTFKLFEEGTTMVTATISYAAATNKAKLDPASDLSSGATYKAVVTTGAKDLAGNPPLDQKPDKEGNQSYHVGASLLQEEPPEALIALAER